VLTTRLTLRPYRNQLIIVYLACYGDGVVYGAPPCRSKSPSTPVSRPIIRLQRTKSASLCAVADRMGWEVVNVYMDHGISGAKSREERPAFDALAKDAARRRFDMVMAWSVDRLGRSLQDLVGFLSDLHAYGIDLFLHQQGLDTTTPSGRMMFQMMGVFAEFERAMIQERVRAGLERARAQGKRLGRRPIDARKEAAIRADLREGKAGIMKLAAAHGVGVGTVQRISRALALNEV
jgi:DNA invertase Pin-like site-specific DNA recombinase